MRGGGGEEERMGAVDVGRCRGADLWSSEWDFSLCRSLRESEDVC